MNATEREYSFDELASLRDYIVLKVNTLSRELERDADGFAFFLLHCKSRYQYNLRHSDNRYTENRDRLTPHMRENRSGLLHPP